MSKTSKRRPRFVSEEEESDNWDRWTHKGKYAKKLGKQERQFSRSARETEEKE